MSQIQDIWLENFRCFRTKQTVRIAPLTFLIGENSTGKTSFLAAVKAISDLDDLPPSVDFRIPYDLGAFSDVVHHPKQAQDKAASFNIGYKRLNPLLRRNKFDASIRLSVTFESNSVGVPKPTKFIFEMNDVWITLTQQNATKQKAVILTEFGSNDKTWQFKDKGDAFENGWSSSSDYFEWFRHLHSARIHDYDQFCESIENSDGTQSVPGKKTHKKYQQLTRYLFFRYSHSTFAGAPIRSNPRRTYEPIKSSPDPEGSYVPTLLAYLHGQGQDSKNWIQLKYHLEKFGKESGLFDEINIKHFGDLTEPFQLEVTNDIGGNRNLIDVGYGVSQILPILAEFFWPTEHTSVRSNLFLLQQPEVHLHPSAQAALGNLFCEVANPDRQLIVETHSDFILDRVRFLVRKKEFKPEDVSFIYFEKKEGEVKLHNVTLDEYGNLENTPTGYRSFFLRETNRVLGFED